VTAAARFHVTGVVQGVGFRPTVYRIAHDLGLTGWVANTSDGVVVHLEGDAGSIAGFPAHLRAGAPPMAIVTGIEQIDAAPEGLGAFQIRESERVDGAMTLVSPDIATCPECESELFDPADRRYHYPFINCTNCGPRFTIIADVPYDRPATTMRDFAMCPTCGAEYDDPSDRRFHAQPNACHRCGPRLFLNVKGRAPSGWEWDRAAERVPRSHHDVDGERRRTEDIVAAAVQMLRGGDVLALKGLGGFHLACDAMNESAVARLRERKHRWGKPFAVMFPDMQRLRGHCELSETEAALLEGPVRPIVLLRLAAPAEAEALAPSVAPGLSELGAMLPYTPLHHLLLRAFGGPLVMTSGNLTDEPIAMDNAEALRRLAPLADGFLLHDRGIYSRYDDSVARVVGDTVEMVRRSRGYAPFPLTLPFTSPTAILAAGPEQKNTFCLVKGSHAFVSQHIGDMENAETLDHYEQTIALYRDMFRIEPEMVAYDLHPEYLSTKFALRLDLPAIGVQHHHAHIVSVSAESGAGDPVIGLAYDGTGYGTDGTIWGGEVLLSTWGSFERVAHLKAVPMPGGAAAIRRPARMALGLLYGLGGGLFDHPGLAGLRRRLAKGELTTLLAMMDRGLNSPPTSSMGRLFDAVAALAGVRDDADYEGQAAIELEAIAAPPDPAPYRFEIAGSGPVILDPTPVVMAVLDDVAAGISPSIISSRFHDAVVDASVRVASSTSRQAGTTKVALSGGVFMNRRVLSGVVSGIERVGLTPLLHRQLPVNDGGVSFGQAVVAHARMHEI
jgi:hydrogenase maturation protein HypF